MNEHISFQDLETLIVHQSKPSISIYLPTSRIPTRVQAESLQLRHLIRDAEEQLAQFGLRGPAIRSIIEPAHRLISDSDFWRHQKDGLVVFLSDQEFVRFQVPFSFETELVVGEAYHLKPLLPIVTNDYPFYVLVEYLFPIYRDANTYPNLVESSITGNPDELQAADLHSEAWKLIEDIFTTKQAAEIEQYHNLAPRGLTSTNPQELVAWADKGRVETVFIDKQAVVWGVYDQEHFQAEVQEEHTPQNRDLTDMIAIYTLLRKGNVYLLNGEQMGLEFGLSNHRQKPDGTTMNNGTRPAVAAIYRFAI